MTLSDEDLLAELNELAEELGHPPSLQDYREHGEHSATTYYSHFGSWRDAMQAAGFEPREPESEIPKDELRAELRRVAEELGETPSVGQMNTHGKYWVSTYRRHFGSWNDAIEDAGLTPNAYRQSEPVSEEELLAELNRIADEYGAPPTFDTMEDAGQYAARTYIRRFGSWNEAVEAAGFDPNPRTVTDEELLDSLSELAAELGKQPTAQDLVEHGGHSLATYQRRFGSWSAALEAALDTEEGQATSQE